VPMREGARIQVYLGDDSATLALLPAAGKEVGRRVIETDKLLGGGTLAYNRQGEHEGETGAICPAVDLQGAPHSLDQGADNREAQPRAGKA
jgi:hypothetical protein